MNFCSEDNLTLMNILQLYNTSYLYVFQSKLILADVKHHKISHKPLVYLPIAIPCALASTEGT